MRTQFKAETIQHHVKQQESSGLSIAQYCQDNNLNLKNFYNWRSNLNKQATTAPKKQPSKSSANLPHLPWVQIKQPQSSTPELRKTSTKITLNLPGNLLLTIETH